jgi:hypothetical protein
MIRNFLSTHINRKCDKTREDKMLSINLQNSYCDKRDTTLAVLNLLLVNTVLMDKVMDLYLHMQTVPISTNIVSWNLAHGEVYLMQRYVIKFVSYL